MSIVSIIIIIIAIIVFVFTKTKYKTTIKKEDENGKIVTEKIETVYSSAGQTFAKIIVGILLVAALIIIILLTKLFG